MDSLLTLEGLAWATPDGRPLGQGISLQLRKGQLLWIQGPNGAGKSSLLRVLLQETKPASGTVRFQVADSEIGYLPQVQNRECHLPFTLGEVIALAPRRRSEVQDWGLLNPSRLDLSWNQASGGERQRTLLTRELINGPEILILDEPLNHLDDHSRTLMQATLTKLLQLPHSPAVILVSHEAFSADAVLPRGGFRVLLDGQGHATCQSLPSASSPHPSDVLHS